MSLATDLRSARRRYKTDVIDRGAATTAVAKALREAIPAGAKPGSVTPANVDAMMSRAANTLAPAFGQTPDEITEAMREQGLDFTNLFAPGQPITPSYGYSKRPRAYNYVVGQNITTRPRMYRVPFETIDALWQRYDIAQICTKHIIDDMRSMELLFSPMDGIEDDVTDDIKLAKAFLESPDGDNDWCEWLGMWMTDILKYDGGLLYKRRDNDGNCIGLKQVDMTTILPVIDYWGDRPRGLAPAYVQFAYGIPWDWLIRDDTVYTRLNPQRGSEYGLAPLEMILLTANLDVRFQMHFLQYFAAGSLPAGLLELPPDVSRPDQVEEWQEFWDAIMVGDQEKLNQLRFVPAGTKFQEIKGEAWNKDFPVYILNRTISAYGLVPHDLGFTNDVNRATGDTQMDVQFRVSSLPKTIQIAAVLNKILHHDLGLKCSVSFDTGQEKADRLMTAQTWSAYIASGIASPDEARKKILGFATDPENPVGRFISSPRVGPIPMSYVIGTGGKIDPKTFLPEKGSVLPEKFVFPGQMAPDPNAAPADQTKSATAIADADSPQQSQALPDERKPNGGEPPPAGGVVPPGGGSTPGAPGAATKPAPAASSNGARSNGASDGKTPSQGPASKEGAGAASVGSPEGSQGITTETGIEGIDLYDGEKNEDLKKVLLQWRDNSRTRIKNGLLPRRFQDSLIPVGLRDYLWERLEKATTIPQVVEAFFGDLNIPVQKHCGHCGMVEDIKASGIVVRAMDTGRVLMMQRPLNDEDENSGAIEFPGGHIQDDEDPAEAAKREWQEETGSKLPKGYDGGHFHSVNGNYMGFIWLVDDEDAFNPKESRKNEDADPAAATLWLDPHDAMGMPSLRPEARLLPWQQIIDAGGVRKAPKADGADRAETLARKYAPQIAAALTALGVEQAIAAALAVSATGPALLLILQANIGFDTEKAVEVISEMYREAYSLGTSLETGPGLQTLLQQAGITIQGMNATTLDRLSERISQGITNGDSVATIAKNIDVVDPARALMIVDTETRRAVEYATQDGYRASGITQWQWEAAPGACPACAALDGTQYPVGSGGPPLHPMCRCTSIAVQGGSQ